jgi:hypothetical protein
MDGKCDVEDLLMCEFANEGEFKRANESPPSAAVGDGSIILE